MPKPAEIISHWHHSLEDFNTSTLDFYMGVEATLSDKQAPIKPERVDYHESGVMSGKREYLRISYGRFSFDISAFPFGKDFMFSWWLVRRLPESSLMMGCAGIIAMPITYLILAKIFGVFIGFGALLVLIGAALAAAMNGTTDLGLSIEDAILSLPILGWIYRRFIRPVTYYSEDSRLIFEEAVHRVVLKHVETLTTVSKLPPLTDDQKKPETRRTLR